MSENNGTSLLTVLLLIFSCLKQSEAVEEKVGFVEVRPGAHMFWLLQYSTHPDGYLNGPWILWLQGGPGLPGSGFANYLMFGPKDIDDNERNTTWLQSASIVYVDNPVGVGFSYVEPGSRLSLSIEDISNDLISFITSFLLENVEFQQMPLYIFGQSYGGKMATAFTYYLEKHRKSRDLRYNLKGLAIGNGYVTPIDYIYHCYEMLYQMSYLDDKQREATKRYANDYKAALTPYNETQIMNLTRQLYDAQPSETSSYNILRSQAQHNEMSMYTELNFQSVRLKMAEAYQQRFPQIPSNISYIARNRELLSGILYGSEGQGSTSVHHLLDDLLYNSNVQVIVYSGQYDVICCTSGALAWVRRLTWPGMKEYHQRKRDFLSDPHAEVMTPEMYVKATSRFKFYWVLRSGHVVPRDVPEVALRMLNRILDDTDGAYRLYSSHVLSVLTLTLALRFI